MTGSVEVIIDVTDANNKYPTFGQDTYLETISESTL